ncbi:hypothetical protein [Paraburkholderia aromaticivorans]|uniref:hypothetical protein n=1 Tax=Paraburkholderia aromaticivorans TaxID=2026199 RepID=UPI0038BE198F
MQLYTVAELSIKTNESNVNLKAILPHDYDRFIFEMIKQNPHVEIAYKSHSYISTDSIVGVKHLHGKDGCVLKETFELIDFAGIEH